MTETPSPHSIAVLGAGSWGTALAVQLARAGQSPVLWGRAEDEPELLAKRRSNQRYLPGVMFPPQLTIEPDIEKAVGANRDILVCVPSHVFRLGTQTNQRNANRFKPDSMGNKRFRAKNR